MLVLLVTFVLHVTFTWHVTLTWHATLVVHVTLEWQWHMTLGWHVTLAWHITFAWHDNFMSCDTCMTCDTYDRRWEITWNNNVISQTSTEWVMPDPFYWQIINLRFYVFMHWLCARYKMFLRLRLLSKQHWQWETQRTSAICSSAVNNCVTVISFFVNVPVLSEHITSTQPAT